MKVLVLGGNGLFGRKTVINLVKDPDIETVVSMDVSPVKPWVMKSLEKHINKFQYVRGDVSELEDILNAIKLHSIDRIVNWAFLLPGVVESSPRPGVKVNALGMCNAFEAARLMGVPRVIYASSEGVYGPQNEYGDRDVVEDDHMHPGSGYAIMKQFAEILAQQYTDLYGTNFSAVRPTIGYGHGGLTPAVIKQFSDICSLPAVGKTFSVESDGTNRFSLASADDVAEITRLLLHMDASPHSAYNVGTAPASLRDAAEAVRKYIPDAKIEFGNQPPPPDSGESGIPWRISMERAKADLGFSMLPLKEAVLIHINDARMEAGLEPIKA
ncbi:NAD-dependent epimerase/dehydratase family protein [Chloroflexota bacterium]